jgi:hypothetical protein
MIGNYEDYYNDLEKQQLDFAKKTNNRYKNNEIIIFYLIIIELGHLFY